MSTKDLPQFTSGYHDRPTPEKMIKALKSARRTLIVNYRNRPDNALHGVCVALPGCEAGSYLSAYIRSNLQGEVWLNAWRRKKGLPVDAASMHNARLAWIGWMITSIKKQEALSK
jgi:hypothetical protein